jgi:hypothetical protein
MDFASIYPRLAEGPNYKPGDVLDTDRVHTHGTHSYVGGSHAVA